MSSEGSTPPASQDSRQPAPKAPALGALRAARLRKGHSLEAAFQQTRIPKKYLEALEQNRAEDFPAPVYLRGFLKIYCEYLELDFEPLWKGLAEEAPSLVPPPEAKVQKAGKAASARFSDSTALWALAASLGLAAGLALWTLSGREPSGGIPPAAPPPALRPVAPPPEPRLVIELRDEVWLRVSLDGALRFEGRAPRGARQEWKAKRFIALKTSDPDKLRLTLNGAPFLLASPGPEGEYRIEP